MVDQSLRLVWGEIVEGATILVGGDWCIGSVIPDDDLARAIAAGGDNPFKTGVAQGVILDRHGEKLVVIGHSLGGIYARELARRMPQCVEQTILLGSPVQGPDRYSNPFVKMLASLTLRVHETTSGCVCELHNICGIHSTTPPPGVPEAIIFSKADGVVDWMSCLESGPNVRVFEVDSTHCGLPYNLDTLRIVHHLLEAETEDHDGAHPQAH